MRRGKGRETRLGVVRGVVAHHHALPLVARKILPHDGFERRNELCGTVVGGNDERDSNHRANVAIYPKKTVIFAQIISDTTMHNLFRTLLLPIAAMFAVTAVSAQNVSWKSPVEHLAGAMYRIVLEASLPAPYPM